MERILAGASVDQLLNLLRSAPEDHKGIILPALNYKAVRQNVNDEEGTEELITKFASFILTTKSVLLLPTLISLLNSLANTKKYPLVIENLLHLDLDGLKNWPNNVVRVEYLLLKSRAIEESDYGTVQKIFKDFDFIHRLDVAILVKFKSFLRDKELLFGRLMASDEFFEDLWQIYPKFETVLFPESIIEEINNLLFKPIIGFAKLVCDIERRITSQKHIERLIEIITRKCGSDNPYLEWVKFKYNTECKRIENESLLFYFLDRVEEELQNPQSYPEASGILLRLVEDTNGEFLGSFRKIVLDQLKERPRQEAFFLLPLLAILKRFKLADIGWLINYLSFDEFEVRIETIDVILKFLVEEQNQEIRLPLVASAWDAIAKRSDQSLLRLYELYEIEPDFLSHRAEKLQRRNKYISQVLEKIKSPPLLHKGNAKEEQKALPLPQKS